MRYAQIREIDVANGSGIRVSIFVQGCTFECEGCFNSKAWNFDGGHNFTDNTVNHIQNLLQKKYIKGLSVLGGEPLHDKNYQDVFKLIKEIKDSNINKDIWLYTGYQYEDIKHDINKSKLLNYIDILVDGKFEIDKKDLTLQFRGSSNQRVIDVQESLDKNQVVLYNLDK